MAEDVAEGATATATVQLSVARIVDTVVTLGNSDAGEATIAPAITIPAGATSATLTLVGVADNLVDGDQMVTLTASSMGLADATASLDVIDVDTTAISLALAASSVGEGGATTLTISLTTPTTTDTIVALSVDDASEASVPSAVTIPAGQTSADVTVSALHDNLVDGEQSATITASSNGLPNATAALTVTDTDTSSLLIYADVTAIAENGGTATGTVQLVTPLATDLVVDLASSDTGEATVPGSVTILAGESTATFAITAVDDIIADGDTQVLISGTSVLGDADASITIEDDEVVIPNHPPQLTSLSGPDFANKGLAGQTITLSGLFQDADAGDTHSITIDWGDGNTEVLAAADIDQAADSFSANHTYSDGGIYAAMVTLSDGTEGVTGNLDVVITGVGLSDNGVLQIVGTSQKDRIKVKRIGSDLRVKTKFGNSSWHTQWFAVADVSSIDVHLCEGNDRLDVHSSVTTDVLVVGGQGNDNIKTGSGNDQVIDMTGDNSIQTRGGDDVVITGSGKDIIRGGSGNDVLSGGDGRDKLYGGSGSDILIGGEGRDRIYGQSQGDLLIGGTTDYDTNAVALRLLMDEWSSGNDYDTRIANIRTGAGSLAGVRLEAGQTVHNDDDRDRLYGSWGRDWHFADLDSDSLYDNAGNEEVDETD